MILFDRQRVKLARKIKKLTQEGLADKVNTTKGTISNYENGHSTPSDQMLVKIADALSVSTDYLLGRVDDPDAYATKEKFIEEAKGKGLDYSGLSREEIDMFQKWIEDYKKNKK